MKKLSYLFLLVLSLSFMVIGCSNIMGGDSDKDVMKNGKYKSYEEVTSAGCIAIKPQDAKLVTIKDDILIYDQLIYKLNSDGSITIGNSPYPTKNISWQYNNGVFALKEQNNRITHFKLV